MNKSCKVNNEFLQTWAQLGVEIGEDRRTNIWEDANNISICNRAKEQQFRVLHRLQISPQLRNKMYPKKSLCMKCITEVGGLLHTIWPCVHIQDFWVKVVSKLHFIFNE